MVCGGTGIGRAQLCHSSGRWVCPVHPTGTLALLPVAVSLEGLMLGLPSHLRYEHGGLVALGLQGGLLPSPSSSWLKGPSICPFVSPCCSSTWIWLLSCSRSEAVCHRAGATYLPRMVTSSRHICWLSSCLMGPVCEPTIN